MASMKTLLGVIIGVIVAGLAWGLSSSAQARDDEGPSFTKSGQLNRPVNYREWYFVTSGLGMTYGAPDSASPRPAMFDNVFVTRAAHREFLRSGTWPERTMFLLEIRRGEANVSIDNGGQTQGEIVALEAAVKDRRRFPAGGWGYFTFDSPQGLAERATPLPATAKCYSCHATHGAVDNTFVQFYPTLFEVAKRLGTVKPTYDPARKPQ